jgi:hypothetical protein
VWSIESWEVLNFWKFILIIGVHVGSLLIIVKFEDCEVVTCEVVACVEVNLCSNPLDEKL